MSEAARTGAVPLDERLVASWSGSAPERLRERLENLTLFVCYVVFLTEQRDALRHGMRWDVVLFIVKISLEMLLFAVRRPPAAFTLSIRAWAITFFSVFSVMMLRPEEPGGVGAEWRQVGIALMQVGLTLHIFALASLGRSFGPVPGKRGVSRRGPYRVVRHPLYLSIAITLSGYVICNVSTYNAIAFTVGIGLHLLRIREEERILALDATYREYSAATRWRLIPGLC